MSAPRWGGRFHQAKGFGRPRRRWCLTAGRLVLAALLVLPGGACTVGPDWTAPHMFAPRQWPPVRLGGPDTGSGASSEGGGTPRGGAAPAASAVVQTAPDPAWWRIFHDETLDRLEAQAAPQNLRLRVVAMRFLESRAARQSVAAAQFPSAGADASYAREAVSPKGVVSLFGGGEAGGLAAGGETAAGAAAAGGAAGGGAAAGGAAAGGAGGDAGGLAAEVPVAGLRPLGTRPFDLWQYGIDASWELDFWGRVRRAVESADAAVTEADEWRRDALVSVMAEVAGDYLALRGMQADLAIAARNVAVAREVLGLARGSGRWRGRTRRGARGPGSGGGAREGSLAADEAAAQLHLEEAALPALEVRVSALVNALSFLLGEAPGALRGMLAARAPVPPVPPRVPVGVPSELARRRPDIRAAEARLHAATADIGVAIGDFYPRITLDGSVGVSALQFGGLGSWGARQYGIGPSISLPVFSGGRLRATLALRQQQQQEAAILYEETVLRAWREVNDALTAYEGEQRRRDALEASAEVAAAALKAARQLYASRDTDFLTVLDAERTALASQLAASDSNEAVSADLVQLYKALGGGWEETIPAAGAAGK